jgi:hypothetical protein
MTTYICAIGDFVEVFCDHKRGGKRIRDWVEGVVVHADDRMTAIQFRTDVYLTDGWMVPDRILWFNKGTEKIRQARRPSAHATSRAKAKKPSPARSKIAKKPKSTPKPAPRKAARKH